MNQKVKKLPHIGVCTRLAPSKISGGGVGVFAIRKIEKGEDIFYDEYDEMIWINEEDLGPLPEKIRKLYDDFCVIKDDGTRYGCPKSFNQLMPCWYLNSSDRPNIRCDEKNGYKFYALRDISEGEELTVNYETYSELPN